MYGYKAMNVDRIAPLLVVVFGVLAISAAAAGMDSPARTTTIGTGGGEDAGMGDAEGHGYSSHPEADRSPETTGPDVFDWLSPLLALILTGGAVAYLVYVVHELWQDGIDSTWTILKHALTTIVPAGLAWIALFGPQMLSWMQINPLDDPTLAQRPTTAQGGGSSSVEAAADVTLDALPVVLIGLGLVVVIGAVVLLLHTVLSDEDSEPSASTGESLAGDPESSGAFTSPSRHSLDDVDASNTVYRAWRELAADVPDPDRETRTPAEIASRAIENGFDRQAVRTLTDLFEEVRYGQRPATRERESRAESALDSIRSEGEDA